MREGTGQKILSEVYEKLEGKQSTVRVCTMKVSIRRTRLTYSMAY